MADRRERASIMRHLMLVAGIVGWLVSSLAAQDARQIQSGKQLYAKKECAKRHLIAGKGNKIGKLDVVASKLGTEDMRKWLTAPLEMEAKLDHKPKVKMSSKINQLKLTDADVDALVAYLMTLK